MKPLISREVNMKHEDDTIAAIATPIGEGGISVIRISGKSAFDIADKVFCGKASLRDAQTHTAHFGHLVDSRGDSIDEVVATAYRSPHSYTSEDCVEISCHGGVLVTRKCLEAILESGARLAQPGEFTKRAFLNGRIDLSQAEAVADLIQSKTDMSHRSSLQQLEGRLSQQICRMRDDLVNISSLLELELDFAEEDIEITSKQEISDRIIRMLDELRTLVDSFGFGKVYREGVKVVISGKPNVGKSSLLNALLNENRAIVTEIPGTTRDTIEENLNIDGILFRVVDTAGLRSAADLVEKEGVRRTEAQIASSDIIMLVLDLSEPLEQADQNVVNLLRDKLGKFEDRCLVALNKVDIARETNGDYLDALGLQRNQRIVKVSATTSQGLETLKKRLVDCVFSNKPKAPETGVTITNIRHSEALTKASRHLRLALESLSNGRSGEFIALDLRAALDYLGGIVGAVTTEEILENIFSKFCIGK